MFLSFKKVLIFILLYSVYSIQYSFGQLIPNLGGQRTGISSFTFLKNDVSPRAIAMGGAITTMKGDAYSSQWNPATLTEVSNHSFAASTRTYALGINHSFAAANVRLRETDFLAVSVNNLSSGAMDVRTEFMPGGTGEKFYFNTMAIGLSYAKALTYKFSLGMSVKYLEESIDLYRARGLGVDVGFIYKTDFKDLRFGVFLQNFGPNTRASGNYQVPNFVNRQFTPDGFASPTVFKFGASFTPLKKDLHLLAVAAELNHPSDNASNMRFGAEYSYNDILFFRAGYWLNIPGLHIPTAGVGLRAVIKNQIVHINYAFAMANALGVNHNFGLSITFNNPKNKDER